MINKIKSGLDRFGSRISEDQLIVFDRKVLLLIIFCFLAFLSLSIFKIHGSSLPYWNQVIPGSRTDEGLIRGDPRHIRSDEWAVLTPFMLSQSKQPYEYPSENEGLGKGKVPLLMNLPAKHFTAFFRPQNWGFFLLGPERGFSFYWNFKVFGLFVGFFLLLMLLTRNNFWLSVVGAIWIYFSSFIQWWFSIQLPEMIMCFSLMFVFLTYVLQAKKRGLIVLGGLGLIIFSVDFILLFYPPFQIPLLYLLLFLIAGYGLAYFSFKNMKEDIRFRIYVLAAVAVVSLGVLAAFYLDVKGTMSMVMDTVYPGKRFSPGGERTIAQYFGGYFNYFMDIKTFPQKIYENVCEASNFVFLFPPVFMFFLLKVKEIKKLNKIVVLLLGYLLFISLWVVLPFPHILAKLTLLSHVPSKRAILGLGVAGIILAIVFLAEKKTSYNTLSKKESFLTSVVMFLAVFSIGSVFRQESLNFVNYSDIFLVAFLVSVLTYTLLDRRKILFSAIILFYVIAPTYSVNPISKGLSPIYGKDISKYVGQAVKEDPGGKWIVYGNFFYANFLKASGANVFNGVKYSPDLENMHLLDPENKYENVYNRYAHIEVKEAKGDDASFLLKQVDLYTIFVNPCSDKLAKENIDHFVFTYKIDDSKYPCLVPEKAFPENSALIYKRVKQ